MNLKIGILFCFFVGKKLTVVDCIKGEPFDATLCGYQHSDDYYHADEVALDEFPWLAALVYKSKSGNSTAVLCSGSLITRRYVLTAAGCLKPNTTVLSRVVLGMHNITSTRSCTRLYDQTTDCSEAVQYRIKEILPHEEHDAQTGVNDIGLVRLVEEVQFTDYIRPICLPFPGTKFATLGETLQASGWGKRIFNEGRAEIKKKVSTYLIAEKHCVDGFSGAVITENHMCTMDHATNEEFICEGDAGAPVMFADKKSQWHIEGISSWGGRCGPGHPQVHTRVSNFIDWIVRNVKP